MKPSNSKRPVFIDLNVTHLPIPAIASLLHRISGVLLFLAIPFFLCALDKSVQTPFSFANLQATLSQTSTKLFVWAIGAALIYHAFAGIRHLIMDMGFFGHLPAARMSAKILFLSVILAILLFSFWLW